MKSGRILVLNQFFHPEYVTASVLMTQMAEDAAAAGIGVDVLCGKPKEYLKTGERVRARETYRGIRIRRAGYLQLSRKSKLGRLLNYFSFIASVALRWPGLLGYGAIVVNTMPPLLPLIPAFMNILFGRKFVFICYDLYPELAIRMGAIGRGSAVDRVMRFTNRRAYPRAAAVVALGGEMKRYMLESGLVRDEGRIRVIPNWYDGADESYRGMDAGATGNFTVVYSGNMGVCQDMDTILKCAAALRGRQDVRFVFTGHGNKAGDLKREAALMGLGNVTFHGYLMGREFEDMLASADCFLVSLEKGIEGLAVPSKTYSYLAAGRPVLAVIDRETDISRMLELYGCGFTVDNGDAAGMAERILEMAGDRAATAEMGMRARRLYEENYKREICTRQYIELFRDVLGIGSQESGVRRKRTGIQKTEVRSQKNEDGNSEDRSQKSEE